MRILFFQDRKGDITATQIVGWLIALAVLVVIITYAPPIIIRLFGGTEEVGTCGGVSVGGKQGVCVPESTYCNEKIKSGCAKYPGRPVCCYDSAVIAEVSATRYCLCYENSEMNIIKHYNDYATADECKAESGGCGDWCSGLSTGNYNYASSCVPSAETKKPIKCRENSNCYLNIERCTEACDACVFDTIKCK